TLHRKGGAAQARGGGRTGNPPPVLPRGGRPGYTADVPRTLLEAPLAVERIAVLGAGIMGRGIAYAAAVSGFETRLYDAIPKALNNGEREIKELMDKGVVAGKLTAEA